MPQAFLVPLESLVWRDCLAAKDPKEIWAARDHQDPRGHQDRRDHLAVVDSQEGERRYLG